MEFNSEQALKTLRENAVEIQKLGEEIEKLQLEHVVAKAQLMDAEQVCREDIFTDKIEMSATRFRDWVKWKTAVESKEEELLAARIRMKKDRLEVLREVNASLKFAYRIIGMEVNNLNLGM